VGCVIVSPDGHIVGRGWTQPGGRPHAETVALAMAGEAARGATAYVTLEPCAHFGQTPPCADALVAAGVARVVAAVEDPDPRVAGRGFATLEAVGIAVTHDVLRDEAAFLNEGFFKRIMAGQPMVAVKSAESADGFVAKASVDKWITGERAREHAHLLRAQHEAIMVGSGTVLADDPMLTCRLPGMEDRSPLRVILDSDLRLPSTSRMAQTAWERPTLVFTASTRESTLPSAVGVVRAPVGANGRLDLTDVLRQLANRGITRVLVEGGPALENALLDAGLADRVHLYKAPQALGGGVPGIGARVKADARFAVCESSHLGRDIVESYRAKD